MFLVRQDWRTAGPRPGGRGGRAGDRRGSPATKAASLVAADAPVKVLGPPDLRVPRRREAPSGARSHSVDPRGDCLTPARRRVASRIACCRRGRGASWPSTSVRTAGVGVRNDRVTVMERTNVDLGARSSAVRAGSRRRRPVVHLVPRGASGARARRGSRRGVRRPGQAAVRGGAGRRGERRGRAGSGGLATRPRRGGGCVRLGGGGRPRRRRVPCGVRRATWSSCSTVGAGWMMHGWIWTRP